MRSRLNILILGVQVPFTRGGAELLIDSLRQALQEAGHCVDVVSLPFSAIPKTRLLSHIASWRQMTLDAFAGREVDMVIATKFPSYCIAHPCKVVWLIHQHRQLYELYGTRFGDFDATEEDEALKRLVIEADRRALSEAQRLFTIAPNVSERMSRYLGISSVPLTPPLPLGGRYRSGPRGDYLLSVGRLCSIKRVDLMLDALPLVDDGVRLKIVGAADEPALEKHLHSMTARHHLENRVDFLGRVSDEDLIDLYADCLGVYYAPHDEDYGFVAREALASAKPVITASDSGSVKDVVKHETNGLVAEPSKESIAQEVNRLALEEGLYERLSAGAQETEVEPLQWPDIVRELCSGVSQMGAAKVRATGN